MIVGSVHTFSEGRMSQRMKTMIGDFVNKGSPLTLTNIGAWDPYDLQNKAYFEVNSGLPGYHYKNGKAGKFWNEYLPYLSLQLSDSPLGQAYRGI